MKPSTLGLKDGPAREPGAICSRIAARAAGGIWIIDAQGYTTQSNARLAALLGYEPAQMLGHRFSDFVSDLQRATALTYLARRKRGVAEHHEFEFVHRDGRPIWLSMTTFPILDTAGLFHGAMSMAADITAKHQTKQALAQARLVAQGTLDGLTSHICVLDDQGRILMVNHAWREFARCNGGLPTQTEEGVDYLSVCNAAAGPETGCARSFARGLREVLAGRHDAFELEYPCHSPTEERWFVGTASRIENSEPARVVVAHQPVTARKIAQSRLLEAQKMEALGTLAGGVAHDFNNALATILGSATLGMDSLPEGHPARNHLLRVLHAGRRTRSLVEQILAFSRDQPHEFKVRSLRPLVEETIALLRATLPAEVELCARLPDAPVLAMVNAMQFEQVLINLGTNAWHAVLEQPGVIEIGLEAVELDNDRAALLHLPAVGSCAHIWVRDNGVGMDDVTRLRIFEPFFTTKAKGHGTGLGLAVVYGIVGQHRGMITVESRLGHGSTFHLHLPVSDQPEEPLPKARLPVGGTAGSGGRVLVVDDDEVVGLVTQSLLEREGYHVQRHGKAREGLFSVISDPCDFDLVITDLSMPDLSGLELAAELARIRPALPVILMSGYITDEVKARARACGVRAVLRKESAFEELAETVIAVLTGTV